MLEALEIEVVLALVAGLGLAAYIAARLAMRRPALRLLMRLGVWGGVAFLVLYAVAFTVYYQAGAWWTIGADMATATVASRLSWLVAAPMLGIVIALRRPVRGRKRPSKRDRAETAGAASSPEPAPASGPASAAGLAPASGRADAAPPADVALRRAA